MIDLPSSIINASSARRRIRHDWPRFVQDNLSLRFRADAPDSVILTETTAPAKNGNILLPTGTPVFYLHGTFSAGESLTPLVNFIQNIQNEHPGYISYIPEVRDGTGIETVKNPKTTLPAYKAAIRDMGDFHYQIAHHNLTRLKALLDTPMTPEALDVKLGEFFNILPAERALILPVVKEFLAYRVFELPPEFKTGRPISDIVAQQVARLRREVNKMELSPEESKRPFIDTHFLRTKAMLHGKEMNLSTDRFFEDQNIINLRTISFKDIATLEAYLMFIEKKLRLALENTYRIAYTEPLASGQLKETDILGRAKRTAAKLMEKIAPQGMAFGHSQGGTVLMSALLNHLAKSPKTPEKALEPNAPGAEELGGRYIGIQALFSSPLSGIPDEPAWGKTLTQTIERWLYRSDKPTTYTRWVIKKLMWRYFDSGRPAVIEMKAGSSMVKKFQTLLPLVKDEGLTLLAAHDIHDTFVEPSAALLQDSEGKTPQNVFNISLEAPIIPPRFEDGLSMIEAEIRNHGLHPNTFLVKMLRWMPNRIKEAIFEAYLGVVTGLGQHGALVSHPTFVRKELGQKLIVDPQMQTRVLDTQNFEPFRYQALIARGKSFQRNILDLPLPQAIKALNTFESQYPMFLAALIENAREWVPIATSASFAATRILEKTLDLLQKAIEEPTLKQKFAYSIQRALRQIAEADLLALTQGGTSPSKRAKALLPLVPETLFR